MKQQLRKFANFKISKFSKSLKNVKIGSNFVCVLHTFQRRVKISSYLEHFWILRHFHFWTITFKLNKILKKLFVKYRFMPIF